MSDFVRKSDVLDLLYGIFDKYKMSTDKNTSIGKSFGTDVFEEIRNMPTAYSVEKVVEELKQSGVFDDVCEWKSASDGEFIQNPHTKRLYSNEPSMQNVYCNTCGKKIKVVN